MIFLFISLTIILFPSLNGNAINDNFLNYQVIDGDSLKRHQMRYRIHGIDAPELKQICWIKDQPWSCGEASRDYLRKIQGREGLFCIKVDEDRYRRDIVKCSVQTNDGIKDVGSIMVEEGYALAYRQYSKEYIEEEKRAKDNKKGIWKSRFIYPWEWRRKN
jgi:endonuclease YncB( thermonuclease family)